MPKRKVEQRKASAKTSAEYALANINSPSIPMLRAKIEATPENEDGVFGGSLRKMTRVTNMRSCDLSSCFNKEIDETSNLLQFCTPQDSTSSTSSSAAVSSDESNYDEVLNSGVGTTFEFKDLEDDMRVLDL